jgi:hypothetical protein
LAALVDEGIVLNKDGSFERTAKFRGLVSIAPCRPNLSQLPAALTLRCVVSNPVGRFLSKRSGIPQAAIDPTHCRTRRPPWSMPSGGHSSNKPAPITSRAIFLTLLYLPPDAGHEPIGAVEQLGAGFSSK